MDAPKTPIRFDPETGRLEGTDLPPADELIRRALEAGMLPVRNLTWMESTRCGCAIGLAAALLAPEAFRQSRRCHTIGEAAEATGIPVGVALGITYGFDTTDAQDGGGWLGEPEQVAGFAYGRAARIAAFGK